MADKTFADYVKDLMSILPTATPPTMFASPEARDVYEATKWDKQKLSGAQAQTPTTPLAQGLLAGAGGGGDSYQGSGGPGFFDVHPGETPQGRDARVAEWAAANPGMAKFTGWAQDLWSKTPYGQIQNTLAPQIQQNMNLSNLIPRHQQNSRYGLPGVDTGGITYAELDRIAQTYGVPAMSQQAKMLAEQEAGMFSGNDSYSWGGGDNSNRSDPGAVGSIADTRND